ncbi:MAG: hypothetical protein IJD65_05800, partial [Mailhella sp.]|nr:hypothetical protein [Mailhella sp.]
TTFFDVFSERLFGAPLLPAPWGFLRAAVPQREDGLCPRPRTLSNTFWSFFEKSLQVVHNLLIYLPYKITLALCAAFLPPSAAENQPVSFQPRKREPLRTPFFIIY